MDPEQLNAILKTAGVTTSNGSMNMANIMANVIFGSIGFVAAMYGWKNKFPKPLMIGVVMSIYPFFLTNTLLLYSIGVALCALLYFWRD